MQQSHQVNPNAPIAVFDSGMGGLTVLSALSQQLPHESFVYLGDTARLPYGTKSAQTVVDYASQMVQHLMLYQPKLLVIACNTATTAALPSLQQRYPNTAIIGVVEPGARAALKVSDNLRIALLATETTIRSGVYQNTLKQLNPKVEVFSQSCGLFVALAEEGCINDEVSFAAMHKYLHPLAQQQPAFDSVILGCTHFPVLTDSIRRYLGDAVHIVNSADETAKAVKAQLNNLQLARTSASQQQNIFLVTDMPERFAHIGSTFFGNPIDAKQVNLIDIATGNKG